MEPSTEVFGFALSGIFLNKILHGHMALLEPGIVLHPFANSGQIVVSVHAKQFIARKMIQQEGVNTHLIELAHLP
jgi:hypothetical protein